MLDYLKVLCSDTKYAKKLYYNPLLEMYSKNQNFRNNLNKETNVTKQATYIKVYKEILFCFFTKDEVFTKLEILIKPHYYFNNNLHNANDFTVLECINTLTKIKELFNLPVNKLTILNIEFGLNALSPIDCKDLILCAIYHEKNEFINSSDSLKFSKISFKHHKNGKANKYKQIKFYAKGLQFLDHIDINTFRFEIKSKERKYIKSLGVYAYADLLKAETYNTLADIIELEFKKVLILDINNKGLNLTNKELSKLNEYLNPIKWVKSLQGNRNLFNKHKVDYQKLLNKTRNNIHTQLNIIVGNKLQELLKKGAISTPNNILKKGAISDVYIIGNCTQHHQNRNCIITGVDLSKEKAGSIYIKTTTLKFLRKNDKKKFSEICSLLLGKANPYHTKYEKDIITHLAKQIRNRVYNKNTIRNIGYNSKKYPNQYMLPL